MMPPIIAIGGPVGAGKSSVAALLAEEIRRHILASDKPSTAVRLLRSDVLRKQILGVDLLAKLPQKYYESELYSRTIYTALHTAARSIRSVGEIALIDATYTRQWQRADLAQLAVDGGLRGFWLDVAVDERIRRLDDRHADASDAQADLALKQQIERPANEAEWECISADLLSAQHLANSLLLRLIGRMA
ncbi:MAG: AAA family ATPase [Alphaproteobacteria bacterium]